MKYLLIHALSILSISGTLVLAETNSPQAILQSASSFAKNLKTYSSDATDPKNPGLLLRILQRNLTDGTFVYRLTVEKNLYGVPVQLVTMGTPTSHYDIIGEEAFETPQNSGQPAIPGMEQQRYPDSNYSVKIVSEKGNPCFEVTETISQKRWSEKVQANQADKKVDASQSVPAIIKTTVGKSEPIVYRVAMFNKSGKPITDISYFNVKINPGIDENLLAIPAQVARISTAQIVQKQNALWTKNPALQLAIAKNKTKSIKSNSITKQIINPFNLIGLAAFIGSIFIVIIYRKGQQG